MDWQTIVKRYFNAGYYNSADVAKFVTAGKITKEQYEEITGETYSVSE